MHERYWIVDTITVKNLQVETHIGVPAEERASAQTVAITLRMVPSKGMRDLNDQIATTVDYYAVSQRVHAIAAEQSRQLIETLAEDIAHAITGEFAVAEITVEIRKFILPDTDYVAVELTHKAVGGA